jgi:chaperonin cofactor prefoldin
MLSERDIDKISSSIVKRLEDKKYLQELKEKHSDSQNTIENRVEVLEKQVRKLFSNFNKIKEALK